MKFICKFFSQIFCIHYILKFFPYLIFYETLLSKIILATIYMYKQLLYTARANTFLFLLDVLFIHFLPTILIPIRVCGSLPCSLCSQPQKIKLSLKQTKISPLYIYFMNIWNPLQWKCCLVNQTIQFFFEIITILL